MEIKELERKDRILQLFDVVDECTVNAVIQRIWEINLEDEIWKNNVTNILKDYGATVENIDTPHIQILLSTYGGSVYDGLSLYDVMCNSKTQIDITCSGKIMSMGIVLLLGAHNRYAYKNTTFMIHQVSAGCIGKLEDMEESTDEVKRLNERIFNIIVEKTKITRKKLNEIKKLRKDWFITAEEALELGLIDKII